jgi:ribosomal protein S27E
MVHCPACDAILEQESDFEFADMGSTSGFFEASKRFYLVACGDCGAAIASGVAGGR